VSKLLELWNSMDASKRVVGVLGVAALITCLVVLTRMATQPAMVLLYSGLEARQSGDVVQALEQRGEAYTIKGGTIFVPAQRRDELRMTLASEGLPANSSQGYELLDSLSGFGTTSQMFDAAYLRAKEGELARTIVSSPAISMARVHIAQAQKSAFDRGKNGTASVFVTPAAGGLDSKQARALKYLVASAVAGIVPENVAIVDEQGGLIGSDETKDTQGTGDELSETLKNKVERLLEARVGAGNAIVEISVETILQSESITERFFDPEGRVVVSTDNEERTDTSEDSGSGNVTVASNLPDGDAAGQENSKSNASETRERVNYEVSETQREILKAPGAIKRLSVAVLVNGSENSQTPGLLEPRSAEEMGQLTELVQSAVGFDEARGDSITVQSMAFVPLAPMGSGPADTPLINMTLDLMTIIQMAILALVGIVIALLVVRPIFAGNKSTDFPALEPPSGGGGISGLPELPSLGDMQPMSGEIDFGAANSDMMTVYDGGDTGGFAMDGESNGGESPAHRLREMIETRQEETVDILRHWLEQKEKQNS
jgi:flagellar M-ring protein FliF